MILENNEVCIWFYINNSLLAILSYLRMFLSEFTVSVHFSWLRIYLSEFTVSVHIYHFSCLRMFF